MLAKYITQTKQSSGHDNDWNVLWAEIQAGNKDSLAKIFCYTYEPLFNYGFKIAQDEYLIKDCIQELFLNLWLKRENIGTAYSVKSYLMSSLRRVILRNLEKGKNQTKRHYEYDLIAFNEVQNIEDLLIHFETENEKKQQMMEALLTLSYRQKEAIYLKFYNGLSYEEIATIMQVNRQSAYNHISSAIHKMQDYIAV